MTEITSTATKDEIISAALEYADYQSEQSVSKTDVRNIAVTCLAVGITVGALW